MDDVIKEFLAESHENLDRLERDLVALEKSPGSKELLAGIFRTIHTIKGSSGFLGLGKLESITHAGESLLSRLRDGKLSLNAEITTGLLSLVDAVRTILGHLAESETEGGGDYAPLAAELIRLQGAPLPSGEAARPKTSTPAPSGPRALAAPQSHPVDPPTPKTAPVAPPAPAPQPAPVSPLVSAAPPASTAPSREPTDPPTASGAASEGNVRVDVGLLDRMMNLVGELVLARNQMLQLNAGRDDAAFGSAGQRLNLVTTELQEEVMKTRLQPIGNVWSKLPRLVRDTARELGKQVRLELEGQETELDRTIIEAIKDPLIHLVRNAIDHGLESPADRRAAGKAEAGVISLRAFHEGGQVNLEIRDDGRGIDVARVKAKALERGLIGAAQAAQMGPREALHLIFLPGVSTARQVTNVSGRGVGMDVVRTNIERVGGSVDLETEPGRGTTVRVRIPLTLAIIPALMVTNEGERYAIPQVNLVELVRLEVEASGPALERVFGAPVYRLRGRLLPLVFLREALQTGPPADVSAGAANIVVVQAGDRQFGLVVDKISDTQEIVVKPLGKHLKGIPVFAGATILGDGRVALILDVLGLAQGAMLATSSERGGTGAASSGSGQAGAAERQRLLLFHLGDPTRRLGIDLSTVGRLEKIPCDRIERAGGREVVQYRGEIMSLLRLAEALDGGGAPEEDTLHVVVCAVQGRTVGLVVGHILDIVEESFRLQAGHGRQGILGQAVIQGRVTEIVDAPAIVRQCEPFLASAA